MLSTPPPLPCGTVNGEGPAALDPGLLIDVGDVDTPEFNEKIYLIRILRGLDVIKKK
jgi:hypothetical protein